MGIQTFRTDATLNYQAPACTHVRAKMLHFTRAKIIIIYTSLFFCLFSSIHYPWSLILLHSCFLLFFILLSLVWVCDMCVWVCEIFCVPLLLLGCLTMAHQSSSTLISTTRSAAELPVTTILSSSSSSSSPSSSGIGHQCGGLPLRAFSGLQQGHLRTQNLPNSVKFPYLRRKCIR